MSVDGKPANSKLNSELPQIEPERGGTSDFVASSRHSVGKDLGKKTVRGGAWQVVSAVGHAVLQFGSLMVLSRFVPPSDFGIVAIATMATAFASLFSRSGLGPALIQKPAISETHVRTAFWSSLVLAGFCAAVLWAIAPSLARFFRIPNAIPILRVSGLSLLAIGASVTAHSLLSRAMRFKLITQVELAAFTASSLAVLIPLAIGGYGAWAIVWANIAHLTFKAAIFMAVARHPVRPLFAPKEFRELFAFGGGLTLAQFANYIAAQADFFIVGRAIGTTALGLYERSFRLTQVLSILLGDTLDKTVFPAMSRIQEEQLRLGRAFGYVTGFVHTVLFPVSAILIVLAPEVVSLVLGSDWSEIVAPVRVLLLGLAFRTSSRVADSLVRAKGAVYRNASLKVIYAAAVGLGTVIGIRWGLVGVAWGVLGAVSLHYFMMINLSMRLLNTNWKDFLTGQLSSIALAGFVSLVASVAAHVTRVLTPSAFLISTAVGLITIASTMTLVLILPKILGRGTLWLLRTMLPMLEARVKIPRRVAVAFGLVN